MIKVKGTLSFPNLFEARQFGEGAPKYSASLLFEKDSQTYKDVEALIEATAVEKWGKVPRNFTNPLKDGDEKEYEGYPGRAYFRAANKRRPQVVHRDRSPVVEDDDVFYPGCEVVMVIGAFAWAHPTGGKGVSISLEVVQFKADGESLGGTRVDVNSMLDDLSEDDD